MKKIAFLLTLNLMILFVISAQQVDSVASNILNVKDSPNVSAAGTTDTIKTEGSETNKSGAVNPTAKPKSAPWCEGIGFENGNLIFKNVVLNGIIGSSSYPIDLNKYGISGNITNEHLK